VIIVRVTPFASYQWITCKQLKLFPCCLQWLHALWERDCEQHTTFSAFVHEKMEDKNSLERWLFRDEADVNVRLSVWCGIGSFVPTFLLRTQFAMVHTWICWNSMQYRKFKMLDYLAVLYSFKIAPLPIVLLRCSILWVWHMAIADVVREFQYCSLQIPQILLQVTFLCGYMLKPQCLVTTHMQFATVLGI
jgi:hypothetical protein